MRGSTLLRCALLLPLALLATQAQAELSQKQVHKLITKMAGLDLPSKAVHIEEIKVISPSVVETKAEMMLVFRLSQNKQGDWRLIEIRTGQEKWEKLEIIARAMNFDLPTGNCDAFDILNQVSEGSSPGLKRTRCLIAALFGVTLPSDAIRIKEISSMGLPLGSEPSALAVSLVQVEARLTTTGGDWHVAELRSGNRGWLSLEAVRPAVDRIKQTEAIAELNVVAHALATFRHDRGSFVVSDKYPVLIDYLSPRHLLHVIRLDPWHNPYQYQGQRDHFTLRSAGPDGTPDTVDDILVTDSSPGVLN